jgi:hypothetical protein
VHRDSYGYADYERDLLSVLDEFGVDRVSSPATHWAVLVALLAATRSDRIGAVLAIDVKSDWTDADDELAERSRDASQRVEPDRDALVDRLARTLQPVILAAAELELLAQRSLEPVADGWRFLWDRRVLDTEPVDPFGVPLRRPLHALAGGLRNARAFACRSATRPESLRPINRSMRSSTSARSTRCRNGRELACLGPELDLHHGFPRQPLNQLTRLWPDLELAV